VSADPVALTFDVDWAPDFAIDATADLLVARGFRATWLVTHRSAAIDRLRDHPELFELGIHPNFREGSTHGSDTDAILRHCMAVVPDAISMRTHSLVQSTPLLARIVGTTPIRIDASLLLPRVPGLRPFEHPFDGVSLLRVPFDWEDDVEMEFEEPRWAPAEQSGNGGLRTFNFHPMHVYLNSRDMTAYRAVRASHAALDRIEESVARAHRNEGEGTAAALRHLLETVSPEHTRRLRDLR